MAALAVLGAAPGAAAEGEEIYPMYFPLVGDNYYSDTWGAARGGGRTHEGTDIMAAKLVPIVAVASGTVGWMHNEQGGKCCAMALEHDDGWASWYIHMNNDTPGTDDGLGWGFAPGIERGVHVEAGQLIGYVGDSGNAEWTAPHLHFELHLPDGTPINPYPHLVESVVLGAPIGPGGQGESPCEEDARCDGIALVGHNSTFALHRRAEVGFPEDSFHFGDSSHVPLMGDWDCDGVRTPGMYDPADGFVYLRNSNSDGAADVELFVREGDEIPLTGDFNGDGCDTVSVYRAQTGQMFVKNSLDGADADYSYYFGNPGDKPFTGDFDGNGIDTLGLHRESVGSMYFRNTNTQGIADFDFFYGNPGDRMFAGDWNGDGTDTLAIYRPLDGRVYYRMTNTQGIADFVQYVGDYRAVLVAQLNER